jgi:hypothetical protein
MNNVYVAPPIYLLSGIWLPALACGCVLCSLVVHSGKWFVIIITGCKIHRLLRPCFSRKSVLSFDDTTIITTDNNSNAIINDSRFIKVVTQHDAFKKQPDSIIASSIIISPVSSYESGSSLPYTLALLY